MKKKWIVLGSILAGIAALWIILKQIPFKEIINLFSNSSPLIILGYIGISVLIMLFLALRWKIILKSKGYNVSLFKLFSYRIAGYGVSYLTPAAKLGGEPVRAGLLSRDGISFSEGLSTIIIDKTIEIATNALFFFIGVMIVLFSFAVPGQAEIMMLLFALIFLGLMLFIYHRLVSGKGFIKSLANKFKLSTTKVYKKNKVKILEFESAIIKFFKHDKKDFYLSCVASFFSWVCMFVEYKFAGLILGFDFTFVQIFLIVSFIGVAMMIPIPMGLGSMELSQVTVFALFKMGQTGGVALAFLVRARDLLWSVVGLIILSFYGLNPRKFIEKEYENN